MSDFDDRSRRLARERYWQQHSKAEYECPDCGRGQEQVVDEFQVHHKSGDPHDNRIEQLVGLCGFCHRLREDKKPSLKRIEQFRNQELENSETDAGSNPENKQYDRPLIYTAGRMMWHNSEDSTYRAAIDEKQDIEADFLHPHDTYFDHGGDFVSGCVAEDIGMIDQADAVVAFFDETGQTGTMTELFHALKTDTPALVLFSATHTINLRLRRSTDPRIEERNLPQPVGTVGQRLESELWFLINYLNGDNAQNPYGRPHQRPPGTDWGGAGVTTAAVSKSDESITAAIRSWVGNDLQSIDYSTSSITEEEIASAVAEPGVTDPEVISDE